MTYKPLIKMNLSFFQAGEKTEKATPKKRREARGEGNVAKSQEVSTAFLLLAIFFSFRYLIPKAVIQMMGILQYSFTIFENPYDIVDVDFMSKLVSFMFSKVILISAPILAVTLVIGILSNLAQVGWHPTTKPLMPKLNRLSPIAGFKRLFSMQAVVNLVKSIAKLAIIIIVIYNVIKKDIDKIPGLLNITLNEAVIVVGNLILKMGFNVAIMFMFIAVADYAYSRFKHSKDLKMSKQEIKEEYKQMEGNPEIKGKIKRKMREISMRRMMSSVPQADVIITNPTHFAVAIKYEKDGGVNAPIVVAKGVDFLAKRIKDVAKENNVEIVENPPLARSIYSNVDIGKEIPPNLYQAVAEILAYVYKLKENTKH